MQNGLKRNLTILVLCSLFAFTSDAQLNRDTIQKFILTHNGRYSLHYPEQVAEFYRNYKNRYAWVSNDRHQQELQSLFNRAAELGLNNPNLYQPGFLGRNSDIPVTQNDSFSDDMKITDVTIGFLHELIYGSVPPVMGYNGLDYVPDCVDIPELLAKALVEENIAGLVSETEPRTGGYESLKQYMFLFSRQIRDSGFSDSMVWLVEVD